MKIKLYNTISFNKYKLKLTYYLEVTRYIVFLSGSESRIQYNIQKRNLITGLTHSPLDKGVGGLKSR